MDVFVDDKPYATGIESSHSLADLVNEVRSRADDDRMVVAVRCNGHDITGDRFEENMAKAIGEFEQVHLYTGHPRDLVEDAMAQADTMLNDADRDRAAVVELLGAGKVSEGIEHLGHCMRQWHQVHQGILNALAILDLDARTIRIGDQDLDHALNSPRDRLLQVKDALEARDYVLLADTLQYEFAEVGETWRAIIDAVRQALPAP